MKRKCICGLAKVVKIEEAIDRIAGYAMCHKRAVLQIDNEIVEVTVYCQYPDPDHKYTYDNVVPHHDWIREGMEVDLSCDMDGYFIQQEISAFTKEQPVRRYE
jgi:hypothetical protein